MKRFNYHFNRPKTKQLGYPVLTLHFNNKCYFIKDIEVNVPTKAKFNSRQPIFIMSGVANSIKIRNKKAVIT